jgi:two-component system, NarL family, response regulator DevR
MSRPSTTTATRTVVLATAREVLALGFAQLLADSTDLDLAAVVRTPADACRAVLDARGDLVVVDVHLDGEGGLAIDRALAGHHPPAGHRPTAHHCFVLDRVDGRSVARLTRGGAAGFVHTTASAVEIRDALRHAGAGPLVMDPVTARAVADAALVSPTLAPGLDLTERDLDLLDLLGDGRTNREIAAALYLSEKTVKNCLSGLFRKLGVRSRTAAALLATGAARAA